MPKFNRRQRKGRDFNRQQPPQDDGQPRGYKNLEKKNEMFEEYYKTLGIVPEAEFEEFLESLRRPLPSTFRITGYKSQSQQLLKMMKHEFFSTFSDVEIDGRQLEPPTCLPWYPDELAWKLDLSRTVIRKNEILKKLHQFLVAETESGNISRQEAVSMIPPLVLDVQPHHKILDMCAAPGSKTSQIIEYLHADEKTPVPDGFVVANDSDNKRCYLMVHQVKRLQSPNFMIINHDAALLPNMRLSPEDAPERKTLFYDRVLADVPCSGDGTMRKNPDIWKKWTPKNGINLHGIQKRILRRGVELLEVGGRLVYSTCSLNPIEDEAVVANMLDQCEGCLELLDVSLELPGLKFVSGINSWKVMSKTGDWYDTWEDVPESKQNYLNKTMFPPSEDKRAGMHLERCMRILPHLQDSGGFFVAVVQKVKQVPWRTKELEKVARDRLEGVKNTNSPEEKNDATVVSGDTDTTTPVTTETSAGQDDKDVPASIEESGDSMTIAAESNDQKRKAEPDDSGNAAKKKKVHQLRGYKEDPFIFYKDNDASWPMIRDFYDIGEDFPFKQLMVRCETGKKRNIYFLSPHLKNLVLCNEDRIKFINMGVKVFSRSPSPIVPCDFRLAQDGVNAIHTYVRTRKIDTCKEDLINLLTMENPFFHRMTQQLQNDVKAIGPGSAVFDLKLKEEGSQPVEIVIVGWVGKTSCRSFVPKNDRLHYLTMLGVPPSMHGNTEKEPCNKTNEKTEPDHSGGDDKEDDTEMTEGGSQEIKPEKTEDSSTNPDDAPQDVAGSKPITKVEGTEVNGGIIDLKGGECDAAVKTESDTQERTNNENGD